MDVLVRILVSIVFLVAIAIELVLYRKKQQAEMAQFQNRGPGAFLSFTVGVLLLLLVFFKFWLLTRFFSLALVLVLLGASLAGTLLYLMIGSISGLTVEDTKVKVGSLSTILGAQLGAQRPLLSCLIAILGLLIAGVSAIGSLWVYWTYPSNDPTAKVWIASFLFVFPQIMAFPVGISFLWPIVTSEYLDNDLRNSYLTKSFSSLIYSTIYLLFPLWLFQDEIGRLVGGFEWSHLLISIPVGLFVIGGVIPHFIGMQKHRAQSRRFNDWRSHYLRELRKIAKLPLGPARERAIEDKLEELREEIRRRFAGNKLFKFYQDLGVDTQEGPESDRQLALPPLETVSGAFDETERTSSVEQPESRAAVAASFDQSDVPGILGDQSLAESADLEVERDPGAGIDSDNEPTFSGELLRDPVQVARRYLHGKAAKLRQNPGVDESVFEVIRENQRNLVRWDIRFEHLDKLLRLYEVSSEARTRDVEPFISASLEDQEFPAAETKRFFGPVIIGIITSSVPVLLEIFDEQLEALFERLVS